MVSESSDEYSWMKLNPCSHYSLIQLLEYCLNFSSISPLNSIVNNKHVCGLIQIRVQTLESWVASPTHVVSGGVSAGPQAL